MNMTALPGPEISASRRTVRHCSSIIRPSVGSSLQSNCSRTPAATWSCQSNCCGQTGVHAATAKRERSPQAITAFRGLRLCVARSARGRMLIKHYPELFAGERTSLSEPSVSPQTHELISFLVDVMGVKKVRRA